MASTGHSGSHSVQSMHSSGSMTRKLGPSWKQSTGQTSTQSMYLHLMQLSVTTNVIRLSRPQARSGLSARGGAPWRRHSIRGASDGRRAAPGGAVVGRRVQPLEPEVAVLEVAPQRELD